MLHASRRPAATETTTESPTTSTWITTPTSSTRTCAASVRRATPGLALLALLAGCYTPPPGIEDEDVIRMENVRQGDVWVFFRPGDIDRERAAALAPEVEGVRQRVGELTGVAPPRAQLVVFDPPGAGGGAPLVDRVVCLFLERDYTIRFRYPLQDEPLARTQLLGTVGHEVAEATVLGQVTALDPFLRWMCDGVAELVEHEVLAGQRREDARELLGRTLRFVQDRRVRGTQWVDLTRWRQLGDRLHRTQRLVADGAASLSLAPDDLPRSLDRVRRARAAAAEEEGVRRGALDELEQLLVAVSARERLAWRAGEGRTDDPEALDYLFYNAAFALWLHAERAAPGALGRVMTALAARREQDPVLLHAEALALLREATGDVVFPALDRVPLVWIEQVLKDEEGRLSR